MRCEPRRRDEACGVIWFRHIPKTGGGTVRLALQTQARSLQWTFFDHYLACRAHGGDILRQPDLSLWRKNNNTRVQEFFRELDGPRPRVVVHQHDPSPNFYDSMWMEQIDELNATLVTRGCLLMPVVVLGEPIANTKSRMLWAHGGKGIPHSERPEFIAKGEETQFLSLLVGGEKSSCVDARNWSRLRKQEAAAWMLDKACLVGRTENLTSFVWQVLRLMGWNSSALYTLPDNATHHATGIVTQADMSLMERDLTKPEVTDRWLYLNFSSPTGLPPTRAGRPDGARYAAWISSFNGSRTPQYNKSWCPAPRMPLLQVEAAHQASDDTA